MKQFIIFMITVIFLVSCNEKSKVEILPNEYRNYYRSDEVNRLPAFADTNYGAEINDKLIDIAKKVLSNEKTSVAIPFRYELYLSKDGKVQKIKNVARTASNEITSDKYELYTNLDKIDNEFSKLVANWEFIPALKNDKKVNYIVDISSAVLINKDGKYFTTFSPKDEILFRNYLYQNYHIAVEEMPEPIGGIAAIAENVKYPQLAKLAGIQGRVFVKAFINERGGVDRTEIIKGIGSGCDEAAMDAVKKAKFKPGRQRGKPVNVQVTIPILFKLQ